MKYKVVATCHGFRGRFWEEGEIVEVDPSENPPKHFVPLEKAPEPAKVAPHRTEPLELAPGQSRPVVGGLATAMNNQHEKIPRVPTTEDAPAPVPPEPRRARRSRRASKKKDAGSVKRSS